MIIPTIPSLSWPLYKRGNVKAINSLFFSRWLQSLTMEVILSTAFGIKAETQTVENDPITELAKKAMAPHPLIGIMCRDLIALFKKRAVVVILSTKTSLFYLIKLVRQFVLKETLVIYMYVQDNEHHHYICLYFVSSVWLYSFIMLLIHIFFSYCLVIFHLFCSVVTIWGLFT